VAARAIARRRHVIRRLAGRNHTVVARRAREALVRAAGLQRRMIEASREAAAGLMTLLAEIRGGWVRRVLADGLHGATRDVAIHARLGFHGRILMIDRIRLFEIAGRRVTRVALPAARVHGGVHGIARMALS